MRWTRRQLRSVLEQAGHAEVPEPRPQFVSALESRLHGDRAPVTSVITLQRHSNGPGRFLAGALAAAAVVATVFVAVDRSPSGELRLVTPAGRGQDLRPVPTSTPPAAITPTHEPRATVPGAIPTTSTTTELSSATPDAAGPPSEERQPPDARQRPPRTERTATSRSASLQLDCRPMSDGDDRGIGCEWSPGPDGTAGFRLWREGGGQERRVIMAVKDPTVLRHFDRRTVSGSTYTYLVEAVAGDGRTIARSNLARATCC